jgi:tetratricopeptide (TPR) repeat protein
VENPLAYSPLITRLLTSVKLLGLYFWKMVLPLHLSSDYSFNQIPMSTLGDPGFWLALGTVVALALLALRTQLSSWLVGSAVATAVALGMALNLFFPTGTLFAERLAYFPLVGFSVALASLIEHPWIARRLFVSGRVLLAAVLLAFFVRTVFRNLDWKDEVTVFTTMARTAPESAKALTLSGILQAGQQPLLARSRFERALQIYPEYSQAKLGLAQAEINFRNYSKAEELLTDVLKTDPNSTEALQALAVAYRGSGKFEQSLQISERITARRPDDALALSERAMALEGLKRNAEAKAAYQKAISAGADSAEIRNRFGSLYLQEKNFPAALEQFLQAGRLQPSDPVTYYNLADVYRQTGDKVRERQAYIDFLRNWRGNPRVAATIRSRLQALQ